MSHYTISFALLLSRQLDRGSDGSVPSFADLIKDNRARLNALAVLGLAFLFVLIARSPRTLKPPDDCLRALPAVCVAPRAPL